MATTPSPTPPEQPASRPSYGYTPGRGGANPLAGMALPFNPELVTFLLVEILFAILWLASDEIGAAAFMTATSVLAAAYLLSRGIAKASRVLEH